MANLPERPEFEEGIYQIELTDPVVGGVEGISNRQARQLANRTGWLKQAIEQIISGAQVVAKATRLETARKFIFKGAATGEASFDGSRNTVVELTLADTGIKPGSYPVLSVNEKGLATSGRALLPNEIPGLPWDRITSGKPTSLAGYGIKDALQIDAFRWENLPGKPNSFPPSGHNHQWSNIVGRPTTLAGYGITDALQAGAVTWANLPGKPASFPPGGHNHSWNTITNTPTTLAGYGITDAFPRNGGVFDGPIYPRATTGVVGEAQGLNRGGLEVRSAGNNVAGNAAFISFHRPGIYAAFFGLDTDNKFKIGGWSMGDRAYELLHTGNQQLFASMPGQVSAFAMASPPAGWLKANGAAVSRTAYANLFAVIGTYYGPGDGETTFNLPDLRGEFIRGWDDARGLDFNRGFGSIQGDMFAHHIHTATAAVDGAHAHPISGYTTAANTAYLSQARQVHGAAIPTIGIPLFGESANGVMVDGHSVSGPFAVRFTNSPTAHAHDVGGTAVAAGAHTHAITVHGNGGHETRPRNVALLHCIKY